METTAIKIYSLDYKDAKTYLFAAFFILGNLALPQICHLLPQGGLVWLPIYFFTLIGAYKYGWRVGLFAAILSPLLNALLFGMPMMAALPAILIKSTLLATLAGIVSWHFKRVSLLLLTAVVLSYQVVGSLLEWAFIEKNFYMAVQDFRIGIPGMLFQIIGGYLLIKYIIRK